MVPNPLTYCIKILLLGLICYKDHYTNAQKDIFMELIFMNMLSVKK